MEKWSLFLNQDFLSNTELFYSDLPVSEDRILSLGYEESKHATKVLRKSVGDEIYVTNGKGSIFRGEILSVEKREVKVKVINELKFKNKLKNYTFLIPNLHNKDRMRFAVEKLIELGFTNIVIYNSSRTLAKGFNRDKWEKVLVAAIKQSLRAYLPEIRFCNKLTKFEGENICVFEQQSEMLITEFIKQIKENKKYTFLLGPEGGLAEDEIKSLSPLAILKLSEYRLRSETAIISVASIIATL
jgi:16S rRNA (uracil1498-N3)-methyltransferase